MIDTELVDVRYDASQNANLADSFKKFYRLDSGPDIKRTLVVEKGEYNRFLKSRTRQRTQFEAAQSEIDLSFQESHIPFQFVSTKTDFIMPNGEILNLFEELDGPCGITKLVTSTYRTEKLEFQSYFQAEGYVLAKFLEETK